LSVVFFIRSGKTMSKITLILGGARSGKSSLAEKLGQQRAGTHAVLYVATLEPYDEEMRQRVTRHQASRPTTWRTVEAPFKLTDAILAALRAETLVLVDCLTVWSGNRIVEASGMLDSHNHEINDELLPTDEEAAPTFALDYDKLENEITTEINRLIGEIRHQNKDLILVSNEVGMGLVPPYPLGRAYRDLLGRLNQRIATQVDEVLLVVAGLAVDLKRWQAELFL